MTQLFWELLAFIFVVKSRITVQSKEYSTVYLPQQNIKKCTPPLVSYLPSLPDSSLPASLKVNATKLHGDDLIRSTHKLILNKYMHNNLNSLLRNLHHVSKLILIIIVIRIRYCILGFIYGRCAWMQSFLHNTIYKEILHLNSKGGLYEMPARYSCANLAPNSCEAWHVKWNVIAKMR